MRMEIFWKANGRTIIRVKVTDLLKEMVARDLSFIGEICFS